MNADGVITRTCPPIKIFIFQDTAISAMQLWFQDAGRMGVEDVAIAAGFPTVDGDAVVTAILHPDAERHRGWYEQRDGASWDELYEFGHRYDMYYLLQLHTHPPGCSTRHSRRDDVGAFSDRIGFLSIVIPNFAAEGIELHDPAVTIHERTREGWRVWPHSEALNRIRVIPTVLDLQRTSGKHSSPHRIDVTT